MLINFSKVKSLSKMEQQTQLEGLINKLINYSWNNIADLDQNSMLEISNVVSNDWVVFATALEKYLRNLDIKAMQESIISVSEKTLTVLRELKNSVKNIPKEEIINALFAVAESKRKINQVQVVKETRVLLVNKFSLLKQTDCFQSSRYSEANKYIERSTQHSCSASTTKYCLQNSSKNYIS